MFFSHLMNIRRTDLVLEIGPGSLPHWRADVLADKFDSNDVTPGGNFGGEKLRTDGKPFFKLINNRLPFKENAFDYVICSHVLEHVPAEEIPILLEEIFRVAPKAYIEFPAPLYDVVHSFEAHINFLDIDGDTIYCLPKTKASCINKTFTDFTMHLRTDQRYHAARGQEHLFAVGREFCRGQYVFDLVDDEESFFRIVKQKTYYCHKAALPWRAMNWLRGKISTSLGRRLDQKRLDAIVTEGTAPVSLSEIQ